MHALCTVFRFATCALGIFMYLPQTQLYGNITNTRLWNIVVLPSYTAIRHHLIGTTTYNSSQVNMKYRGHRIEYRMLMSLCVKIWKFGCQCVVLTYFRLWSNGKFLFLPETKIDYLKFLITVISTKFVTCDTLWQLSYLHGRAWPSSNHSYIYFLRSWQKHCVREWGSSAKKEHVRARFIRKNH